MPPKRKATTQTGTEPANKRQTRSNIRSSGATQTSETVAKESKRPRSPSKAPAALLANASAIERGPRTKKSLANNASQKADSHESDGDHHEPNDVPTTRRRRRKSTESTDELNITIARSTPKALRSSSPTPRMVIDSVLVPRISHLSTPVGIDPGTSPSKRPIRTYTSASKRARLHDGSLLLPTPAPTVSAAPTPRAPRIKSTTLPVASTSTRPNKDRSQREDQTLDESVEEADTDDPLALPPLRQTAQAPPGERKSNDRLPTPESPKVVRASTKKGESSKPKPVINFAEHGSGADLAPRTPRKDKSRRTFPKTPLPSTSDMLETPAATPSKSRTASPFKTPTKHPQAPPSSPTRSSPSKSPARQQRPLPPELVPCLNAQKKAVLAALRDPLALMLESSHMNEDDDEEDDETPEPANVQAHEDLRNLLQGTVERGEGNSCMLVGPRGSGKTKLLDRILSEFSTHEVDPARADDKRPIIIRLSGHAQNNDRLAMREIAWQLAQEVREVTFDEYLTSGDGDEEPIEDPDAQLGPNITLPPSAHLPALIGVLPTLQRPVIVVIDAFDLFAMHPRQSLLYCLLDTVQASYAGSQWTNEPEATQVPAGSSHPTQRASGGLAVVGVTTRVDTINLLEKRVKSRFSGRMIRTAGPNTKHRWLCIMRQILTVEPAGVQEVQDSDEDETWSDTWVRMVQIFLDDKKVQGVLEEMYALTRDVRMLNRVLMNLVLRLKPTEPFPSLSNLVAALELQRCPTKFQSLHALPYPAICLLIAAVHTQTSGHDIMTFEMLHELFKDQVRASLSAPVTVAGGGIGMVKCTREVLASAFEHLVSTAVFVPIAGPNASILREFVKYRCAVDRDDVKRAVERQGQINLRKWLAKAGEVR